MPRNPNNPRQFSRKLVQRECVLYVNRTVVAIPLQVKSEANERGHHHTKARRFAMQRAIIRATFNAYSVARCGFTTVEFTRLGPRLLDDDNLAGAFKAVRDEVAAYLGVDDGPKGPISWKYDQQQSSEYGVRVELLA